MDTLWTSRVFHFLKLGMTTFLLGRSRSIFGEISPTRIHICVIVLKMRRKGNGRQGKQSCLFECLMFVMQVMLIAWLGLILSAVHFDSDKNLEPVEGPVEGCLVGVALR